MSTPAHTTIDNLSNSDTSLRHSTTESKSFATPSSTSSSSSLSLSSSHNSTISLIGSSNSLDISLHDPDGEIDSIRQDGKKVHPTTSSHNQQLSSSLQSGSLPFNRLHHHHNNRLFSSDTTNNHHKDIKYLNTSSLNVQQLQLQQQQQQLQQQRLNYQLSLQEDNEDAISIASPQQQQQQQEEEEQILFNFNDLAYEIIVYIFKFLSPFDLRLLSSVCGLWSVLSADDSLWEEKCLSQWAWMKDICHEKNANIKYKGCSWKQFYHRWCTDYLKEASWYNYNLTRDEANVKLKNMSKGTFVIRNSSKPNNLVISYNLHTKPNHLLLYDMGPHVGVFLSDDVGRIYPTVAGLIKEKKKFLKRPISTCAHFDLKLKRKRDYIVGILNCFQNNDQLSSTTTASTTTVIDEHTQLQQQQQHQQLLTLMQDKCILHLACKWGFLDLVQTIVSKGVNVNLATPKDGKTPLHCALNFIHGEPNTNDRLNLLLYLLSDGCGSQVNLLDHKGRSAIHIAVKQHQIDSAKMVEILLNNGADVTVADHRGLYPLHIATKENNLSIVKLLLKHPKINVNCEIEPTVLSKMEDNYGDSALHIASQSSMLPIVKELSETSGININQLDNKNRTALHRSVLRNQDWIGMSRFGKPSQTFFSHQVVEQLFKKSIDPTMLDCHNRSALHLSIEKGHLQSTKFLAQKVKQLQQQQPQSSSSSSSSTLGEGTFLDNIKNDNIPIPPPTPPVVRIHFNDQNSSSSRSLNMTTEIMNNDDDDDDDDESSNLDNNLEEEEDVFSIDSLIECIEIGRRSQDVQKAYEDLSYAILCGFKEITLAQLDHTISNHYKNILTNILTIFSRSSDNNQPSSILYFRQIENVEYKKVLLFVPFTNGKVKQLYKLIAKRFKLNRNNFLICTEDSFVIPPNEDISIIKDGSHIYVSDKDDLLKSMLDEVQETVETTDNDDNKQISLTKRKRSKKQHQKKEKKSSSSANTRKALKNKKKKQDSSSDDEKSYASDTTSDSDSESESKVSSSDSSDSSSSSSSSDSTDNEMKDVSRSDSSSGEEKPKKKKKLIEQPPQPLPQMEKEKPEEIVARLTVATANKPTPTTTSSITNSYGLRGNQMLKKQAEKDVYTNNSYFMKYQDYYEKDQTKETVTKDYSKYPKLEFLPSVGDTIAFKKHVFVDFNLKKSGYLEGIVENVLNEKALSIKLINYIDEAESLSHEIFTDDGLLELETHHLIEPVIIKQVDPSKTKDTEKKPLLLAAVSSTHTTPSTPQQQKNDRFKDFQFISPDLPLRQQLVDQDSSVSSQNSSTLPAGEKRRRKRAGVGGGGGGTLISKLVQTLRKENKNESNTTTNNENTNNNNNQE
ncbi:ankyrin repeat-containing protein [Cavenderia fasciculata]|uniref:Ankyrin repeat-containing protein n=1 Tax=Cavenderia fasciculata TaxID=261658 RepID=F4Q8I9_CACFS|nr:ankyrin repeat-containing protein [Cavenderia fasciculata]EGG16089.1 ankyrin repeat-containing protein [Cavenderia fasciculata]|eukprot:XP_004352414.1 ankyrin repeat-containing protein [Cavenderia fasciculata]